MEELKQQLKDFMIATWLKGGTGQTRSNRQADPHHMTGKFIESLNFPSDKQVDTPEKIVVEIWGNSYGVWLRDGVSSDRIKYPFAKKRLEALKNWVRDKLRISDERQQVKIAGAIAYSHGQHGFPERNGELGSRWMTETELDQEQLDELKEKFMEHIKNKIGEIWQ